MISKSYLAMAAGMLIFATVSTGSASAELVFKYASDSASDISAPAIYDFQGPFTFDNCGATGKFGPSQADCTSNYSSADWLVEDENFSVQDGIQEWTVPADGDYIFEIAAPSLHASYNDGEGSIVEATANLSEGDVV